MLRCVLLIAILPALVLAQAEPPVPNGHALVLLTLGEFQSYVSGIYEGQALLAEALGVPQAICIDPTMMRAEVFLALPARVVIFRILLEKLPCPGFSWEKRE